MVEALFVKQDHFTAKPTTFAEAPVVEKVGCCGTFVKGKARLRYLLRLSSGDRGKLRPCFAKALREGKRASKC